MNPSKNPATKQSLPIRFLLATFCSCALVLAGQTLCCAYDLSLEWAPNTEADLAGYKVYYQADSSSLPFSGTGAVEGDSPIDVKNRISATISGLDPGHAYYFAVTAYNSSGAESSFSNIVTVPELIPPSVSVSSPANNAIVSGTVSVTASANDNTGVSRVEFYLNGVLQATDSSVPYLFSWNTASFATGSCTLVAKAYDAAGNVGQSGSLSLTVVRDTTNPTVALTAPAPNATVSGTVSVTATAADNVGVSRVEFYDNGLLMSATNVAPYSHTWNSTTVANGTHILSARAYDTTGNIGQSASVTTSVANNGAGSLVKLNVNGTVSYHQTLSSAYNAIANGANATIYVKAATLTESVNFNRTIAVTIIGGYDSSFTNRTGVTLIKGTMNMGMGSHIIEGIGLL